MSKIKYRTEIWTYRDLFNLLDGGKMEQLPHQRPLKLPRNYKRKLIRSVLNGTLDEDIRLGDLIKLKFHSTTYSDSQYFDTLIIAGVLYSIEDGQHRLGALRQINSKDFIGEFEGREDEFFDSEVPIRIYDNLTKRELIEKFGSVNDGSRINGIDSIWGYDTQINEFIKEYVYDKSVLSIFYPITNKSPITTQRIFYGNLLKMLKTCLYLNGYVTNKSTETKFLADFIDVEIPSYELDLFDDLFQDFCRIIYGLEGRRKYAVQSNIFLLLLVLKKREIIMDDEEILDIYHHRVDRSSRLSIENRYEPIYKIVDNYVRENAGSPVYDTSEV